MKLTLAIVLAVASLAAQAACDVEYVLTPVWGESPRRFDVRLTFEAGGRRSTHLEISTEWGGVTDWAKYMSEFPPIIDHAPNGRIEVRYQVINAVANVDAQSAIDHRDTYRNLFGSTYFTAFGHGLFVVPREAAGDGKRYCVEFAGLPAQWSFASSYGAGQSEGRVRYEITSSMDTLRHSLFLGGDFRVIKREVEGRRLYMALRGTWSFDDARFADETARLVEGQRRFWSDYDFPCFVIALLPNRMPCGSTGGTGVFNAFAMHASRDFAIPGEG